MTLLDDEPLEGELVTSNPGTELVPHAGTLFGTSDPRIALERMADIATALVDVIDTKKLYATINGRKHITVEGWTTLGGMLGVVPIVTGTRANDTGDGIVATVEARTLDGRIVGAAEGECSRAESKWKSRDPYAIRSMAQTRAISRALRAPLGQIIVLAGYEATPAEEIPAAAPVETAELIDRGPLPPRVRPSTEQTARVLELLAELAAKDPATDWPAHAREIADVPNWDLVTAIMADQVIRGLEEIAAAKEDVDA
jgi:hypothetical protein